MLDTSWTPPDSCQSYPAVNHVTCYVNSRVVMVSTLYSNVLILTALHIVRPPFRMSRLLVSAFSHSDSDTAVSANVIKFFTLPEEVWFK